MVGLFGDLRRLVIVDKGFRAMTNSRFFSRYTRIFGRLGARPAAQLSAKATVASLPNTCTHTMVSASHWVGLTLPGMMGELGSFSEMINSPMPQQCRWLAAHIVDKLHQTAGQGAQRRGNLHQGIVGGQGKKTYWALSERENR